MRRRPQWVALFAIFFMLAGSSYAAGFITGWQTERAETSGVSVQEEMEAQLQIFWEAWALVDRYFVDRTKLNPQQMVYGAVKGMVDSLGDPYTVFADPPRNQVLRRDLEGNYDGIGISVTKRDNQLVIISLMEGTPSARAGLRVGDVILQVDGKDVSSLGLYDVVTLIRGPSGSSIRLTVLRPGADDPIEITVVRGEIQMDSVRSTTLRGGVVYVKVAAFRQGTSGQLAAVLKKVAGSSPPGLILDLRDNPGGYLDTAVEMASQFLGDGVVLYEADSSGYRRPFPVRKGGLALEVPLAVLVNKGSASASEIVAGALQDRGRGLLIGQTTYGKGSVQSVRELSDGSGLRVTVARWLTPSGRHIQGTGLVPDRAIEPSADPSVDAPLERAIIYLLANKHGRLAP